MKIKYFDNKGKELEKGYEVSKDVFGVKINEPILAQYVYSFNSNQRQANAQTKDRGEVAGGGRKPWNQKGTGRARAGSIRSPIWRGGGVTFGPSNDRNYKKALTKKMVKVAFRSALSLTVKNEKLAVIEKLNVEKMNTKAILNIFKSLLKNGNILLVQNGSNKELLMSVRNIQSIKLVNVKELNTYDILNAKQVVMMEDAIEYINKTWTGKNVRTKKTTVNKEIVKKEVKEKKKETKKVIKKVVKKTVKKIK